MNEMAVCENIENGLSCIGIVGLGYVGYPLAIEFSKYFNVFGFDIDKQKIEDLQNSYNDEENEGGARI